MPATSRRVAPTGAGAVLHGIGQLMAFGVVAFLVLCFAVALLATCLLYLAQALH